MAKKEEQKKGANASMNSLTAKGSKSTCKKPEKEISRFIDIVFVREEIHPLFLFNSSFLRLYYIKSYVILHI